MANLLPNARGPAPPLALLDPEKLASLVARTQRTVALGTPDGGSPLARLDESLETELEELESAASLAGALALLAQIDAIRERAVIASDLETAAAGHGGEVGDWLCYRPGRALSTGEAEIASRGYFDVRDRPPIALWIEAVAGPRQAASASLEVVLLAWVPPGDRDRACAGVAAAPSGSLRRLEEDSPGLHAQIVAACQPRC